MSKNLKDSVILVTGAGSGIGRDCALRFAEDGARVVVADVDAGGGQETSKIITEGGGESIFVPTDVSQESEVMSLMETTIHHFGRLDGAMNNAGILGDTAPTAECSEDNWDKVIAINLKGVWLCIKHEILIMKEQGRGSIVNTSSIAGLVGVENRPAYVASKYGIRGLTKAASIEYSSQNIRINAICPGITKTAMIARLCRENPEYEKNRTARISMGRFGEPSEMATTAAWLLSDEASYITGIEVPVDGGYTAR